MKQYELFENGKVVGHLRIYNTGINSLIGFTGWITSLLAERDTLTSSPFEFHNYITSVFNGCEIESIEFPVNRPTPGIEIIN